MLYFHWNLLSALLHLKIFAWIYWIGKWQTNEGTNRLTNIVTYRSAIGARVRSQIFFWILLIQINKFYCLVVFFLGGGGVDVPPEKSFEFYSYRLITFIFFDDMLMLGHFEPFLVLLNICDQILFWPLCMHTNFLI